MSRPTGRASRSGRGSVQGDARRHHQTRRRFGCYALETAPGARLRTKGPGRNGVLDAKWAGSGDPALSLEPLSRRHRASCTNTLSAKRIGAASCLGYTFAAAVVWRRHGRTLRLGLRRFDQRRSFCEPRPDQSSGQRRGRSLSSRQRRRPLLHVPLRSPARADGVVPRLWTSGRTAISIKMAATSGWRFMRAD